MRLYLIFSTPIIWTTLKRIFGATSYKNSIWTTKYSISSHKSVPLTNYKSLQFFIKPRDETIFYIIYTHHMNYPKVDFWGDLLEKFHLGRKIQHIFPQECTSYKWWKFAIFSKTQRWDYIFYYLHPSHELP